MHTSLTVYKHAKHVSEFNVQMHGATIRTVHMNDTVRSPRQGSLY